MGYKVSVIIPVYNCEKFIKKAVNSVLEQADSESIQLVLVDDGSKDGSGKICDEFAAQYSNILSVHQKNAGVSAARNKGIDMAEGEWLSFLDCDDYFLEGFFEKLLAEPRADLLCCDFYRDNNDFPLIGSKIKQGVYQKSEFNTVLYPLMAEGTVFYSACNKLFKSEIVKNNKLKFVVGMKYGEDMTFVYEYVKHISSFKFIDERLYYYYGNEDSATSVVKKTYETYKSVFLYKKAYFENLTAKASVFDTLIIDFLYQSLGSVYVAIRELNIFEAFFYTRKIIRDSVFSENYSKIRVYSYSPDGIYKKLDPYIFKGNGTMVFILIMLCEIKVKLFEKKNRGENND